MIWTMIDWKYHLLGLTQVFFFSFFILGLIKQLQRIHKRIGGKSEPTAVLSVKYYVGSIGALFAYFLLGASLPSVDFYIVISRFIAIALSLYIMFLIQKYRPGFAQKTAFISLSLLFSSGVLLTIFNRDYLTTHTLLIWGYSIAALGVLIYGQFQQYLLIHHHKNEGAVSKEARVLNILKDVSVIAFSLYVDPFHTWPVLLASSINIFLSYMIIRAVEQYESKGDPIQSPPPAF